MAWQILGIVGSQIKIERVFSIAGILTALRCCRLGSKNLDQLVLLVKNVPDDPHQGCEAKSLEKFGVEEAKIIDQLEEEFEDELLNLVETCPEDNDMY